MGNLHINGRRGAYQLLFAFVYIAIGLSYATNPGTETRFHALAWIGEFVPVPLLAVAWFAAAAVGAVSAFFPRPTDRVGFVALTAVPAIWGGLFFVGFITGAGGAWAFAFIYWLFAASTMVVSGMTGDHDKDHRRGIV